MRKLMIMALLLFVGSNAIYAQQQTDKTRLLLILDCSNSMWDHWQSGAKIKVTQQVLLSFLDSVSRQHDVDVALRVFGHLNKNQIGTRLEVPFGEDNGYQLQSKIKTLVPNGGCTAAAALTDALADFPQGDATRNIILIVTDDMDNQETEGDEGPSALADEICNVARQVQLSGVVVQTFVLGIGEGDFKHADCAGTFLPVRHEEEYARTLYDIFRLAGKTARVVVRLLDVQGELYETEHPMAFYDRRTGVSRMNTIYSVDSKLHVDTLFLDPLMTYDLMVFSRPPVRRDGLRFDVDCTNTVDIIADEGSLRARFGGRRPSWQQPNVDVTVRRDGELVSVQAMGEEFRHLSGRYDVEVGTLPTTVFREVKVVGGAMTSLEVPMPGMLVLSKPKGITTGAIFRLRDGQVEFATDLNPSTAGERLLLQPGQYELVIHPQNATKYDKVQTRRFVIESSQTTKIQF